MTALTPSRCGGTVRLPRLRHLGFTDLSATQDCDVEWAAKTCPDAEKWHRRRYLGFYAGREPLLTSDVQSLESERRRLCLDGGDCEALEAIRFQAIEFKGGVRAWSELQQGTTARITCQPDPAAIPFRYYHAS